MTERTGRVHAYYGDASQAIIILVAEGRVDAQAKLTIEQAEAVIRDLRRAIADARTR